MLGHLVREVIDQSDNLGTNMGVGLGHIIDLGAISDIRQFAHLNDLQEPVNIIPPEAC